MRTMHNFNLPFFILCFFVFSIPWQDSIYLPLPTTFLSVSRIAGAALIVAALGAMVKGGRISIRKPSLMLFITAIFVFWASANALRGSLTITRLPLILSYIQLFIMIFLIWQLCRTRAQHIALLQSFVLGAYVLAGSNIYSFLVSPSGSDTIQTYYSRYTGIGGNANGIAFLMGLSVPIAWYLVLSHKNSFLKVTNLLYLPVGLFGIALTASRGGFIVALLSLVLVPLTFGHISRRQRLAIPLVVLAIGAAIINYVPERNFERISFSETRAEITEGRFSNRSQIWAAGIQAYSEKPIFGVGTGEFVNAIRPILGHSLAAHNVYVLILTEMGVVGITLFLLVLSVTILPLLRLPPPERQFYLILWLALVVSIFPSNDENSQHVWALLAIMTTRSAYVMSFSGQTFRQLSFGRRPRVQRPLAKPPLG